MSSLTSIADSSRREVWVAPSILNAWLLIYRYTLILAKRPRSDTAYTDGDVTSYFYLEDSLNQL